MLEPHNSTLPTVSVPTPVDGDTVMQQQCALLEQRLRAGENVRSEACFAEHPALADDPERALDIIYTEFVTRCELGEEPAAAEFFTRFPQWRTQLERQFQLEELLDDSPEVEDSSASDLIALAESAEVNQVNRRFRIVTLLARGGIGQVMRAVDTELNREVAVKEIQPTLATNIDVRERFLREAEITGRLEHPGVVPVYGMGRDEQERPFYAMRLVRGESFLEAIEAYHAKAPDDRRYHSIEFQKLLRRFLSVCETIAYAHSRGVIHRDIKPQNILLGPFGETLVVDWGLAKVTERAEPQTTLAGHDPRGSEKSDPSRLGGIDTPSTRAANWSVELTQSAGALIGTPAFMSPEQARGETHSIGPASDVYSLGATLHTLLTGRMRFGDSDVNETLRQVVAGSFTRPREWNRAIPRSLEAICLKAMALKPEDRYASPSDLAGDIEHWLADEPVSAARESIHARLARWGRRNRIAVVSGLIALLLITAISTAAAFRINGERLRADRERIEASRGTARLAFDRGFQLTEQYESGEGILWFARALQHLPPDEVDLRRVILTNMDAAGHHLLHRRGAFVLDQSVSVLVFSPDGKELLTTDFNGHVKFWDVETGSLLRAHRLATGRPLAATIAADGTALVASLLNSTLTVHKLPNVANGGDGSSIKLVHDGDGGVAAFSPDGKTLGVGSRLGKPTKVAIWRISDAQLMAELASPTSILQIGFQPHANVVATVGSDGGVRLWEWAETSADLKFMLQAKNFQRITFTPDGKRLITGATDGSIECWDMGTQQQLFELARHTGSVTALACSANSQTVAAAWDSGVARAWSVEDQRPACELLHIDRHTQNLMFRPQSGQMLIMAERQTAVLWDLPDPLSSSIPLNRQRIEAIAFSSDGTLAVTGTRAGTVRLRDGATGKAFGKAMSHKASIQHVSIRSDGAVVLTASVDGTARLWDARDGKPYDTILQHRTSPNSQAMVATAEFSPNGQVVATGDSTGIVRIWNAESGEMVRAFARFNGTAGSIGFSPSGDRIIAGYRSPDDGVRMWDSATGELLWTARHRLGVRCVAISPNGQVALSAGNDETARLWNANDGQPLGGELQHRGEVFVARFSPDSSLAVTGGYDATVRLWKVSTGLAYGEPMHHDAIVRDAVFSADGSRLLTGSMDKTARLWDVKTCLPLSPPLRHNISVVAVGLNPDGKMALTGRIWHLPHPLPDNPQLVARWAKLATQRSFTSGNNVEWLDADAVASLAAEFQARTGTSWSAWADAARESSDRAAINAHAASLRAK